VLHHLPRPRRFFAEAARCVRRRGVVAMIEPWMTRWSRLVYDRLVDEPCEPEAPRWECQARGPLSTANVALPWILFERDRPQFEREFPQWEIDTLRPLMPVSYLLSGGISLRGAMPGASYPFWRWVESRLGRFDASLAMFAFVVLRRTERPV
jgi:hypothetical protein